MQNLIDFKDRIREATSLVELVQDITGTQLKKSGKEFKGLCPFHQEKTPSFFVNEDEKVFHCFGCQEKGDLFSFVKKYKGCEFMDAVKFLADRLGWEVPKTAQRGGEGIKQYIQQDEQYSLYDRIKEMLDRWAAENKDQDKLDLAFDSVVGEIAQLDTLRQQRFGDYLARKPYNIKPATFREKLSGYGIKNTQKQSNMETKTLIPGLVHLVKENGKVGYLLDEGERFKIQNKYSLNGLVYQPKQDLSIKMPDATILQKDRKIDYKKLLDDLISFIRDYIELPVEWGYFILALWVFHTCLMEKFNTTPIIYFHGVKETGKSRAGEVLAELAYFAEWLTSPTEATLFREADYFKTTLIIDEVKLWGSDANQDVARLIKSRYKRGVTVPRCNLNKSGEDMIEFYDVFAPLVICSTEAVPDTIESRCITFLMAQNVNQEVEKAIDEDRARDLRNRLTIFRANKLKEEMPIPERIARRRLNEILTPLYQILLLIDPERKEEFKVIVEEMEVFKQQEESVGLDAEIVQKISNFYLDNQKEEMEISELTRLMNEDRPEREHIRSNSIGRKTKQLGFKKKRLAGVGTTILIINPERLSKLKEKYNIEEL